MPDFLKIVLFVLLLASWIPLFWLIVLLAVTHLREHDHQSLWALPARYKGLGLGWGCLQ